MKLERALPELLLSLRRKLNERMKGERFGDELTFSQLEVLSFVESGPRTMERIAAHLRVKPPSVTAIVDRLEDAGLVARGKDETDRRITKVTATAKAARRLSERRERKEAAFRELLAKLSTRDRKELERILRILTS
ncbi:MAG TPA: MarR family transcriptional regulator [Candidatus Paceibacterota bacterium]|nr:MarR family transcriptional regulator [Candidatus Paceibacterota bacterium]